MRDVNFKSAFTLAEILIAVTVVGVVSALTIPVLFGNYNEKIVVSKVKNFHSLMNQVLNDAIVKNYGEVVKEWKYTKGHPEKLTEYFKPHLASFKDCGFDTDCSGDITHKTLNGQKQYNYGSDSDYYNLILSDGSHVYLGTYTQNDENCSDNYGGYSGVCAYIVFDVNGEKGPNVIGKDTFAFLLVEDNITRADRIVPVHADDCHAGGAGWGCAENAIIREKIYK